MTDEFTVERLRELGEEMNSASLGGRAGDHLIKYADAWEEERDTLRYLLMEALGEVPTPCKEVRERECAALLREKLDDVVSNCWGRHDKHHHSEEQACR